ncbi:NAD(P)-dependent oxidoreductase [Streptomyces sp. NPDC101234]|uniref:NAD(P)-dependent oxidoreductase n=1 Tax=Streptomyces sp. NPDC101234 TaxID=3366138 RepID=UPI00380F7754
MRQHLTRSPRPCPDGFQEGGGDGARGVADRRSPAGRQGRILSAVLERGRYAGVGPDVFEPEPTLHHPLFDHPDIVLTPHLRGMT